MAIASGAWIRESAPSSCGPPSSAKAAITLSGCSNAGVGPSRCLSPSSASACVRGLSTRRVDGLVKALGIKDISKSQVSALAKTLDAKVAAFCSRLLDGGPYPYLWLDALSVKAREEGRVTSVATVVATAVSADGHRKILGLDTFTAEDGAACTRFLKDLTARGLPGVHLVISDDHKGLVGAVLAEQHDEWQVARCYRSAESLAKAMEPPAITAEIAAEVVPLLMAS